MPNNLFEHILLLTHKNKRPAQGWLVASSLTPFEFFSGAFFSEFLRFGNLVSSHGFCY